jgi:hypothetical protein
MFMNPKYLKTFVVVSSSDRDQGTAYNNHEVYHGIESLAYEFGKKSDERYFKLVEIPKKEIEGSVRAHLHKKEQERIEMEKTRIQRQISELYVELQELEGTSEIDDFNPAQ